MKVLKTIFVSLALLLIFGTGVLAEESVSVTQPTAYIDAQGNSKTQTLSTITQTAETGGVSATTDDPITSATLTATPSGSWYWGGDTDGQLTITSLTINGAATEGNSNNIVNIVVGPNGQDNTNPALTVNGGLEIPKGVTLNIFQAAGETGSTPPKTNQCKMQVNGANITIPAAPAADTTDTGTGITVDQGGVLNVYSGSLYGIGGAPQENSITDASKLGSALGIDINGTATVGMYGMLRGNLYVKPADTIANQTNNDSSSPAIDITDGTLTSEGTVVSYSGNAASGAIIGAQITSLSNLTVNGGLVLTSMNYQAGQINSASKGGLWSCAISPNGVSTNTAFGTSTFVITGNYFGSNDSNLTVLSDANLTLANGSPSSTWNFSTSGGNDGNLTIQSGGILNVGVTSSSNIQEVSSYFTSAPYGPAVLNFGSSAATTAANPANGTLNINNGGTLNIANNATVNMYADSTLSNSGTINVEETPSTPTN